MSEWVSEAGRAGIGRSSPTVLHRTALYSTALDRTSADRPLAWAAALLALLLSCSLVSFALSRLLPAPTSASQPQDWAGQDRTGQGSAGQCASCVFVSPGGLTRGSGCMEEDALCPPSSCVLLLLLRRWASAVRQARRKALNHRSVAGVADSVGTTKSSCCIRLVSKRGLDSREGEREPGPKTVLCQLSSLLTSTVQAGTARCSRFNRKVVCVSATSVSVSCRRRVGKPESQKAMGPGWRATS